MKNLLFILLLLPLVNLAQLSDAKQVKVDSLRLSIKTAKHDTVLVKTWIAWDNIIFASDPELDLRLNLKIDSICVINLANNIDKTEKLFFLKSQGFAFNNIGLIYKSQGDYNKSIDYYKKSLKIREAIGDKAAIALTLNNMGSIYYNQGDYARAIDYFTKSLKISEAIMNKKGVASSLVFIGIIYLDQADFNKALEYFTKSLKINEEIDDQMGIATSLSNIGTIYKKQGDYDKALDYHAKSLKIKEEIGDKMRIGNSFNNIGNIYMDQGNYDKALDYYFKSLKIQEEIGYKRGIAASLSNMGGIYKKQGDYKKAIEYESNGLAIAQEIGNARVIRDAANMLWILYKELGKSKESLEMYELYIVTRDSILSHDNQKAIIQQEYKYAYEKQAAADSIKTAEAGKVQEAELLAEKAENKQNQQQQYFLYAGLAIALLFGGFIFKRFKVANRQKAIIEEQKQIVDKAYEGLEEAHKEITDSINYAERIQRSFLATKELLDENLNDYFVFFQPKDVVSGDFYWAGILANGNFAIVNADSTGHGVPGAIMSILNISSIESAVKDKLTQPADIFNDTRKTIIKRLKKDGSSEGGKDGMDASLISFNTDNSKMTYVAAQNPIWIIRDGELSEIKPEKMPIGKHDNDHIPFNGGEYNIQKGDQIYALTDGFQDQFGGPKGKKFMIKKFREYVLYISDLSMEEQHQKIKETFSNWKGEMDQVDDVCVIGVKI